MSFGFSVGDFIAVSQTIKSIVISLQSVGGAKSEYQELVRELSSLDNVLKHLDKLQDTGVDANIDSIKYAALSCRYPLSEFLVKIRKYEKSLGPWGRSRTAKSTIDKLMFTFGQSGEIRKLQAYLSVHIGTINILLAEHGLEVATSAAATSAAHQAHVQKQLQEAKTILVSVKQSVSAQAFLLRKVYSMLTALHGMVAGELITSWNRFNGMVSDVCVSTQQIYAVVVEIRDSLAKADTRMTYFQAPFVVEDPYGFKFPVPAEYDFDLVDAIVRRRFQNQPAYRDVSQGNYRLYGPDQTSIYWQAAWQSGVSIVMAIVLPARIWAAIPCPRPNCDSVEAELGYSFSVKCVKCQACFDCGGELEATIELCDLQGSLGVAKSFPRTRSEEESEMNEEFDSLRSWYESLQTMRNRMFVIDPADISYPQRPSLFIMAHIEFEGYGIRFLSGDLSPIKPEPRLFLTGQRGKLLASYDSSSTDDSEDDESGDSDGWSFEDGNEYDEHDSESEDGNEYDEYDSESEDGNEYDEYDSESEDGNEYDEYDSESGEYYSADDGSEAEG